jgi:hypothetical protein
VLVFASPFFEAALSGDWSETRKEKDDDRENNNDNIEEEEEEEEEEDDLDSRNARRKSISSVITINQANPHEAPSIARHTPSPICFASGSQLSVTSTDFVDAAETIRSAASTPTLSSPPPGKDNFGIGPREKVSVGTGSNESSGERRKKSPASNLSLTHDIPTHFSCLCTVIF